MAKGVSTIRQSPTPPQAVTYVPPQRQPVFSRAFDVDSFIGDESPPFVFILSGHLVRFVAAMRVAATVNTTISLKLNGTEFAQIVIPAGANMAEIVIDQPFTQTDFLTTSVLSGGTGGQDLTIIGDPR